jgi:hypothetical protein
MSEAPRPRRHLPVIGQKGAPDEPTPERPAWQWVALTSVLTLLAWVAFAGIGNRFVLPALVGDSPQLAAIVVLNLFALALSSFLAGVWGGRGGAEPMHSVVGTAGTAAFGWFLALPAIQPGGAGVTGITLLALLLVAGVGGALGSWRGRAAPRIDRD